jgi:glycosyltransferase involved in cell wall biosynthesis
MAMRLPIIATNVGGSPEILENRKYGILIEPNNYQSICESMTEIMENDQLRANLSIACNGIAQKKYSKESMINSYIELYNSELKKCVE